MCRSERHDVDWFAAANAADALLVGLPADVIKALDPMVDEDFVAIVAKLARDLERIRRTEVASAMRTAIATLDVDWPNLSNSARGRIVQAANKAILIAEKRTLPTLRQELTRRSSGVVKASKKHAQREVRTKISVQLDRNDKKVINSIARKDVFFRDAAGRRADEFAAKGQQVIQRGLEKGLRTSEITGDLVKAAKQAHFARSEHYMRVVASQAVNSSRVYGELRGLSDARIYSYIFWAVMDERTTEECALLHETEFRVDDALSRIQEIADDPDPEASVRLKPWVRSSVNKETGKRELYVNDRHGERVRIAVVEQPRVGTLERGVYSDKASLPTMGELGLSYPPLHGLCRSTILGT